MMSPAEPSSPAMTRVWLVEDNRAFSRHAAAAINDFPDLKCTGTYHSCESALAALKTSEAPDVLLLDIGLPGMSGLEGIKLFREQSPDIEILILTAFDDDRKVFDALCAGASGYLLKTASMQEIADALRQVCNGGSPMTPRIARRVLTFFSRTRPKKKDYGLTPREQEILEILVEGLAKKEIADHMSISTHTVDMHLRKIYFKPRSTAPPEPSPRHSRNVWPRGNAIT